MPSRKELPIAELLRRHSQLVDIIYMALYPQLFSKPRQDVISEFFARNENKRLSREAHEQFERSEERSLRSLLFNAIR